MTDRRELTIVTELGHRHVIRFAPSRYFQASIHIAESTSRGTFSAMDGALLLRLLEQAHSKEPPSMPRPIDPKRPIIESSVWPWYLKRALLLGAIIVASLSVWCNQSRIRDWYARQVQPTAPNKKTHQQRERESLDRDRPTRTPLRQGDARPTDRGAEDPPRQQPPATQAAPHPVEPATGGRGRGQP